MTQRQVDSLSADERLDPLNRTPAGIGFVS